MTLWQEIVEALQWLILVIVILVWVVFIVLVFSMCWKIGVAFYKWYI